MESLCRRRVAKVRAGTHLHPFSKQTFFTNGRKFSVGLMYPPRPLLKTISILLWRPAPAHLTSASILIARAWDRRALTRWAGYLGSHSTRGVCAGPLPLRKPCGSSVALGPRSTRPLESERAACLPFREQGRGGFSPVLAGHHIPRVLPRSYAHVGGFGPDLRRGRGPAWPVCWNSCPGRACPKLVLRAAHDLSECWPLRSQH